MSRAFHLDAHESPEPQTERGRNGLPNPSSREENSAPLVDAAALAVVLGVSRGWVYENAARLGGRRLPSGPRAEQRRRGEKPRARLRFDVEEAKARLASCSAVRESEEAATPVAKPNRRRWLRAVTGSEVPLLPIRGRAGASLRLSEPGIEAKVAKSRSDTDGLFVQPNLGEQIESGERRAL